MNTSATVSHIYSYVTLGETVARVDRVANATTNVEYEFHGLGNSTLAAVDQPTGNINASFSYAPFGEVIEATDSNSGEGAASHARKFNDKYVDAISNLSYYGARYYDPTSITWTQGDPLYRVGPDLAKAFTPRRANLYTFSLNNSLRYIDPDGRDVWSKIPGSAGRRTLGTDFGLQNARRKGLQGLGGGGADLTIESNLDQDVASADAVPVVTEIEYEFAPGETGNPAIDVVIDVEEMIEDEAPQVETATEYVKQNIVEGAASILEPIAGELETLVEEQQAAVQQAAQQAPAAAQAAQQVSQQPDILTNSAVGKIVGWGKGQSLDAVYQTLNTLANVTTAQIDIWRQQGLNLASVSKVLTMYAQAFADGNAAVNTQLVPRYMLMSKAMELWPQ